MASSPEKTALVTGASRGIGLAVARALSDGGWRLAMVARGEDALRGAASALGAEAWPADISDAAAVEGLRDEVSARFGDSPHALVNCAGAFDLAPVADTDVDSFDRQLAANLRGPFLLMRAFLPAMLQRGSGHIVSIGSVAGRVALPHNGAYAASKFGLRGLHAVLDVELRGTGVRSTLVEPAATATSAWDGIDRDRTPGLPAKDEMLAPAAVADAVVYALTRPENTDIPLLTIERRTR
ncbi:MAG: SDR family NAD(P)-dependent oxidoreductase [Gemmatimonadota bacterium]